MDFRFVISGLLLLACGSFLDNSRGVLLPVIVDKFHLDYLQSGSFFIAGNLGAVFATFLLLPLTKRFSEKKLALSFALIGIVGLALGNWVGNYLQLVLFAIFLGSILSLYGALSNLFVIRGTEPQTRSKMMCGLHMVYGLTSIVAPLISTAFLSHGMSWAGCLFSVSVLLFMMLGFIGFKIPEEPPAESPSNPQNLESQSGDGGRSELAGLKKWVVLTFCLYMAGEVMTSMWLVTYLIQVKGMSLELSSQYQSGFFAVMTLVRGLCFLSFSQKQEGRLIVVCVLLGVVFFALGYWGGFVWAFPAVGILGPFFPVFLGRVSRVFHRQSKSIVLWILSMGQLTLAICHLGVGRIATLLGIQAAYGLAGVMMVLTLGSYGVYLAKERKSLGGLH